MSRVAARLLKSRDKKNKKEVKEDGGVSPQKDAEAGGCHFVETPTPSATSKLVESALTPASKPEKPASSGRSFHMPGVHMPGKGAARKMASAASAFKKKIRLKKPKRTPPTHQDGSELLAVDDDGASWLEDSDEESVDPWALVVGAVDDSIEASPSPDAEAGALASFGETARSTPSSARSRSPERSQEDVDGTGSEEADGQAASSSSSAKPPVGGGQAAHAMEAGCAAGPGGGSEDAVVAHRAAATAAEGQAQNRPKPQTIGAASNGDKSRVSPGGGSKGRLGRESQASPGGSGKGRLAGELQVAGSPGSSEKKRPTSEKKPWQVTWDAKRFKNVKPLQCLSIWDIPTSKDPNPEPRPAYVPTRETTSLVRTPPRGPSPGSKAGSKVPKQKSFGSADVIPDAPAHKKGPAWYHNFSRAFFRFRRRKLGKAVIGIVVCVALIMTFKMLFG